MASPFPGMNPYLEQQDLWRGVHGGLLFGLTAALTPQIVPRYFVEYEESLYIDRSQFAVADVAVSKPLRKKRRWLSIRDSKDRKIITVIEVLSPSEKRSGADRDRYLKKRDQIIHSHANLVEIDLLRVGSRMPNKPPATTDYCVMVSHQAKRPHVGLWPFGLRDPLPRIPIPLLPGEREPMIELKLVLDRVYDEMGYAHRIYQGEPDPRLSAEEAEWAKDFVPATT